MAVMHLFPSLSLNLFRAQWTVAIHWKCVFNCSTGRVDSNQMFIKLFVCLFVWLFVCLEFVGMAGFFGVAAFGLYNFRNRGKISTSVYLMQLRVAAQGTVVGTLCLGLIYSMVDRYYLRKHSDNDESSHH